MSLPLGNREKSQFSVLRGSGDAVRGLSSLLIFGLSWRFNGLKPNNGTGLRLSSRIRDSLVLKHGDSRALREPSSRSARADSALSAGASRTSARRWRSGRKRMFCADLAVPWVMVLTILPMAAPSDFCSMRPFASGRRPGG